MMNLCNTCWSRIEAKARFCTRCGARVGTKELTGLLPAQSILHKRYMILEKVGQGGMGAVYKAIDLRAQNRIVAVKEMSQNGLDDQELQHAIAAFAREANILIRLNHPSLPLVYAHFEEYGRRYLIMEFIEGATLEQQYITFKKRGQLLPLLQVLNVGRQLCAVLDYLHSQNPSIIFRDLKPSNVMIRGQEQVYLIDFGIARLLKTGQLKDTVALGSPGYAAPEQYRQASTPRSDIYSLGVTLYQLLTGIDPAQNPFHFQPFSVKIPLLERLVMRMVSLDEPQRPASMREVLDVLDKVASYASSLTTRIRSGRSSKMEPSSASQSIVVYAALSPAHQDHILWRAIKNHLLSLITSFPKISIKEEILGETHLSEEQMLSIDTANLVLLFISADFLTSPGCMAVAERAIAGQEMWGLTTQAVLLRPCNLSGSHLAQIKVIPEDTVAHMSIYAQEQRSLDVAKAIRKLLANVLIAGQYVGQMNLLQWLLWLLYGDGSVSCPYFAVGDHAVKYVRRAGVTGVLVHVLDLKNNCIVAEHVVGSHTNADFSDLLHTVAPSNLQSETVQGIAFRDKPLMPVQK